MSIDFSKLDYTFARKPILVGGMAMEYYGLRKSGPDIDFIACEEDVIALIKKYPNRVKNLYADIGVCPFNFEIWRSIQLLKYEDLIEGTLEEEEFLVVTLEKLLLMKALAINEEKYLQDTKLIAKMISDNQYKTFGNENGYVQKLLKDIQGLTYIEKTGPEA